MGITRAQAQALDAADQLAGYRDAFAIDDPSIVYLDGNSLGRLPKATAERIERVVRIEWGTELIRAWDHWMELPRRIGNALAGGLLGARPDEVIVADSTTINLHKLATAALDAAPDRRVIVTDRANFPSDRYVLEGLARARGLEIRWLAEKPGDGPQPSDVEAVLDDDVALVALSHIDYRSAAIADMASITTAAHAAGALALWDCCHSVGAIPIELEASGADLAVGCTYKYVNAGPGAPAFLYVRHEQQARLRNSIPGWFGQRDQFAMGPTIDPKPGIDGWLSGSPPILALVGVEEGVRLAADAGIDAIRAKGIALTELAVALHDEWLEPLGFALGSPRDPNRRGSHASVLRRDARELTERVIARGVVLDFREPEGIRVGLSPLTTRFVDVWDGMSCLREVAS
jgi:kynureninase